MTTTLPMSWSREQVCDGLGISPAQLRKLIRDGKVGYYIGAGRKQRFSPEHIEQITASLEVRPLAAVDEINIPGSSSTRRRR